MKKNQKNKNKIHTDKYLFYISIKHREILNKDSFEEKRKQQQGKEGQINV
jgi:hypothetical protein